MIEIIIKRIIQSRARKAKCLFVWVHQVQQLGCDQWTMSLFSRVQGKGLQMITKRHTIRLLMISFLHIFQTYYFALRSLSQAENDLKGKDKCSYKYILSAVFHARDHFIMRNVKNAAFWSNLESSMCNTIKCQSALLSIRFDYQMNFKISG